MIAVEWRIVPIYCYYSQLAEYTVYTLNLNVLLVLAKTLRAQLSRVKDKLPPT